MAIDANNNLHVSYQDKTSGSLKYATYEIAPSPPAGNYSGTWNLTDTNLTEDCPWDDVLTTETATLTQNGNTLTFNMVGEYDWPGTLNGNTWTGEELSDISTWPGGDQYTNTENFTFTFSSGTTASYTYVDAFTNYSDASSRSIGFANR